jgi:hypothetical protein
MMTIATPTTCYVYEQIHKLDVQKVRDSRGCARPIRFATRDWVVPPLCTVDPYLTNGVSVEEAFACSGNVLLWSSFSS